MVTLTKITDGYDIPRASETAGVSYETARAIYEKFVAHYRETFYADMTPHRVPYVEQSGTWDDTWSMRPVLCHQFDDEDPWAIVWEEGPYEWTFDDFVDTLGDEFGVTIEPVNTWSVRIYPA